MNSPGAACSVLAGGTARGAVVVGLRAVHLQRWDPDAVRPCFLIGSRRTGQAPALTDRALTGCTISRGRQAPPRINRWHRTRLHPTITTENRNLTNAFTPITRRISTSSGVPAGTAWSSTLLVEVSVMAFIRSAAGEPLGAVVIPAGLLRRGLGRGCECCCAPPHPPHSFRCGRGRTRGGTVRRLKKVAVAYLSPFVPRSSHHEVAQ